MYSWAPKNWCFWTVVLEETLESPLDSRWSYQSILKEISPRCSLEGLMLKLKHQYFGHLMRRTDSFEKTLILGKKKWICVTFVDGIITAYPSVQSLIISDSLRCHGLQHARPPCPSPSPRVHSNPCPLCQWCHPTISSSVIPFFSCLRSFLAPGSFQISQFFTSGDQILELQLQSFQWIFRIDFL